MSFMKYQIRMLEPFKDGNILEGRALKAGEVLEVTESEKNQIWQSSGGMIEVLQMVVPNPKKGVDLSSPEDVVTTQELEKPVEAAPKAGGKKNARK